VTRNVVELRPRRAAAAPPGSWYEWWLEHEGDAIVVFDSPSGLADASQDAWLAVPHGGRLRLAVLDGATPPPGAAMFCGLDAATWAAQVTRAVLLADDDIAACLWRANRVLHDPGSLRVGARPQAAVVAADVRRRWDGDAFAHVARASDCVAFARHGRRWSTLFPLPRLTTEAAQVWSAWCATHPAATAARRAEAEDRALGSPAAWRTAAIGRFADPLLECTQVEGFDELVLASDGARLGVEHLDDLEGWLDALRAWERVNDDIDGKRHDDVTVVRWRRDEPRAR
jgi:hypothetical protein